MNLKALLIFKAFLEDFITGVCHQLSSLVLRLDGNCLKIYSGHMASNG